MSIKNKSQRIIDANTFLPDNLDELISARDVKDIVIDAVDSTLSVADGGTVVQQLAGYTTELTPTDNKHFTPKKYVDDQDVATLSAANAYTDAEIGAIPLAIQLACSDELSPLTTGSAKLTFRMPYGLTLTGVRASVTTAATGGTLLTVDINKNGATILSTKLTFDASEKTTTTATTPAVISDTELTDDSEITIDVDAVGSTIAGTGLKVTLIGTLS